MPEQERAGLVTKGRGVRERGLPFFGSGEGSCGFGCPWKHGPSLLPNDQVA